MSFTPLLLLFSLLFLPGVNSALFMSAQGRGAVKTGSRAGTPLLCTVYVGGLMKTPILFARILTFSARSIFPLKTRLIMQILNQCYGCCMFLK